LMESKMAAIGMQHTTLSAGEGGVTAVRTTPEDVFALLRYVRHNRSFLLHFTAGTAQTRVYGNPMWADVAPTHSFASDTRYTFVGGLGERVPFVYPQNASADDAGVFETGEVREGGAIEEPPLQQHDTVRGDLITVLEIPLRGSLRTIAFIVLDSANPAADTERLVAYVKENYNGGEH
jgi:hypothetical protein